MNEARPGMSPGVSPINRPAAAPGVPRPVQQPAQAPRSVPAIPGAAVARPGIAPAPAHKPVAHPHPEDESIALIEDGEDATTLHKKIKAFGVDSGLRKHEWHRQIANTGKGPVRVRSFHAKLSDQGLEYLDDAINLWLDEHPEVDVKLVTTNTGMFDGKFKDLALIVNVWY